MRGHGLYRSVRQVLRPSASVIACSNAVTTGASMTMTSRPAGAVPHASCHCPASWPVSSVNRVMAVALASPARSGVGMVSSWRARNSLASRGAVLRLKRLPANQRCRTPAAACQARLPAMTSRLPGSGFLANAGDHPTQRLRLRRRSNGSTSCGTVGPSAIDQRAPRVPTTVPPATSLSGLPGCWAEAVPVSSRLRGRCREGRDTRQPVSAACRFCRDGCPGSWSRI